MKAYEDAEELARKDELGVWAKSLKLMGNPSNCVQFDFE